MIPVPKHIQKFATNIPAGFERIDWIFYDTQPFVANSTTILDFFLSLQTSPIEGNLKTPGQISGQERFLLRGLGVDFLPASATSGTPLTANDVFAIMTKGALRLNVGSKSYAEWPLFLLSTGGGAFGPVFVSGSTASYGVNGIPDPRACYALARPLLLDSSMTFSARIEWEGAVASSTNARIRVLLKGELDRPIQ